MSANLCLHGYETFWNLSFFSSKGKHDKSFAFDIVILFANMFVRLSKFLQWPDRSRRRRSFWSWTLCYKYKGLSWLNYWILIVLPCSSYTETVHFSFAIESRCMCELVGLYMSKIIELVSVKLVEHWFGFRLYCWLIWFRINTQSTFKKFAWYPLFIFWGRFLTERPERSKMLKKKLFKWNDKKQSDIFLNALQRRAYQLIWIVQVYMYIVRVIDVKVCSLRMKGPGHFLFFISHMIGIESLFFLINRKEWPVTQRALEWKSAPDLISLIDWICIFFSEVHVRLFSLKWGTKKTNGWTFASNLRIPNATFNTKFISKTWCVKEHQKL